MAVVEIEARRECEEVCRISGPSPLLLSAGPAGHVVAGLPVDPAYRKETTVPTTAITSSQAPSVPAPPTPRWPLARYLLHPGRETFLVVHHLLQLLLAIVHVAAPVAVAVLSTAIAVRIALWLARYSSARAGGHLVSVAPGPEVAPAGTEALWNGLHGVLRRTWWGSLTGRPHVAFELSWQAGG